MGEPGPTQEHFLLVGVLVILLASLNITGPACLASSCVRASPIRFYLRWE